MWIYLNNSFLSIVENKDNNDLLHVRGRRAGDIEAIFHNAVVLHTPTGDYKYRADIARSHVSLALADQANQIDYTNFKNSVHDSQRHYAYMKTWSAAHDLETKKYRLKWSLHEVDYLDACQLAPESPEAESDRLELGTEKNKDGELAKVLADRKRFKEDSDLLLKLARKLDEIGQEVRTTTFDNEESADVAVAIDSGLNLVINMIVASSVIHSRKERK